MKRYIMSDLMKWKNSIRRKPLILEGARQVGKTWIVKEFAREQYQHIAYLNFEEDTYLRNLFEPDFDVNRILIAIRAATHQPCVADETLIFLDEIQEATNGLTALKYLYENAPSLHIIVAGSLLGLELHKKVSFPVGKVQFLTLHPMNFSEFLLAMGEQGLVDMLQKKDWTNISLFSEKYKELLKQYYCVGGMPEAVLVFSETKDWKQVRYVQNDILKSYSRDFSKHAPENIVPRIRQIWNSVPAQLSRENRKFVYGLVKEGARAREYEIALNWLNDGGLIHKINCVKAPRLPLKSYENATAFKVYLLDVGLLVAMCNMDVSIIVKGNSIFTEFKGALTEQYVLQELILKHEPFYWAKPGANQEIDFLLQQKDNVVPVEVKSEINLNAKSLRQYTRENSSSLAYRISMSAYCVEEIITNVPLYAVSCVM